MANIGDIFAAILQGAGAGLQTGVQTFGQAQGQQFQQQRVTEQDELAQSNFERQLGLRSDVLDLNRRKFNADEFFRTFLGAQEALEQPDPLSFSQIKGQVGTGLLSGDLTTESPGVAQFFPPAKQPMAKAPVDPNIARKREIDLIQGEGERQTQQASQNLLQALLARDPEQFGELTELKGDQQLQTLLAIAAQQQRQAQLPSTAGIFNVDTTGQNIAFDPAQSLQFFTGGGQQLEDSIRSLLGLGQSQNIDDEIKALERELGIQ